MEDIKKNREEIDSFRSVQEQSCNERYDCKTNRKYRSTWNKDFKNFNHSNSYYYKRQKGWQEKDKERKGRARPLNNIFSNGLSVYQKLIKTGHKSNSRDRYDWSDETKGSSRKQDFSDVPVKLMKKSRTNSIQKNGKQSLSEIDHGETYNLLQENIKQSFNEVCNKNFTEPKVNINFIKEGDKRRKNVYIREMQKFQVTDEELLNKTQLSLKTAGNKSSCIPNNTKNHSASIKNKQKKIPQNLIGELMTMPKENLKKIISDPKIHPKFEIGMEQLVNESRLLLAQKFRNLAESKMNCQGQILQSQLVNDIGNLIDPDLAVDVCQLPPELIKQIGNMFQLDFGDVNENSYGNTKEKAELEKQNMEYHINDDSNIELLLKNKFEEHTKAQEFTESIILTCADTKESVDNLNVCFNSQLQNHIDSECEKFQEWNQDKTNFDELCIKCEPNSEPGCSDLDKKSGKKRFLDKNRSFISKKREKNDNFNECNFRNCKNSNSSDNNCDVSINNNFCEKSIEILDPEKDKVDLKFVEVKKESFEEAFPNFGYSSCLKNIGNKSVHDACEFYCPFQSNSVDYYPSLNRENDCSSQNNKNSCSEINKSFSVFETNKDVKSNDITVNNKCNVGKSKATFEKCDDECKRKTGEAQTNISLIENLNQGIFSHSADTEEMLIMEINEIDNFVHRLNQKKFLLFLKLLKLPNCNLNLNDLRISLLQNVTNGDSEILKKLSKNLNRKK